MNRSLHRQLTAFWMVLLMGSGVAAHAQTSTTNSVPASRVTFYTEPNFGGEALTIEPGASVSSLDVFTRSNGLPWTAAISSVRVSGAAKAILYSARGFGGDRLAVSASIGDLYGEARGLGTWDRSITSVSVSGPQVISTPALQAPPPRYEPPNTLYVVPGPARAPRPMYNPQSADMAIRRAYRDVLGREVDREGLQLYRQRLLRDGWGERELYASLQQSREARSTNPDEAITRLYREVLRRDPDPAGLAHYRQLWRQGWTQGQIRDDLRRSDESRSTAIRASITRVYAELLGRAPDPNGYATYERLMREKGWSERQVREAIMQGEEYRRRRR